MKKIFSIFVAITFVFTLCLPLFASAQTIQSDGITWSEAIKIYTPKKGNAFYPRPLLLQNKDIMLAFDANEDNIAFTSIKVIVSKDGGNTFGKSILVAKEDNVTCATPQLVQFPNGEIWCSYRTSYQVGQDWFTAIKVKVSNDGGLSWNELSNGFVVDEAKGSGRYGGIWEPHISFVKGKAVLMYCDDSDRVTTVGSVQNIISKTWLNSGWSEASEVSAPGTSRDGMPVYIQLMDKSYATVFESTDTTPALFGIKYKLSKDGVEWTGERLMIDTPSPGKVDNAPYITELSNKKLLCTFQSDEANQAKLGLDASSGYAIVGTKINNKIEWSTKYRLFPVSDKRWSTMLSSLQIDYNKVLVFCTSNEPNSGLYMKIGTYGGDKKGFLKQQQILNQSKASSGIGNIFNPTFYENKLNDILAIILLIFTCILGFTTIFMIIVSRKKMKK